MSTCSFYWAAHFLPWWQWRQSGGGAACAGCSPGQWSRRQPAGAELPESRRCHWTHSLQKSDSTSACPQRSSMTLPLWIRTQTHIYVQWRVNDPVDIHRRHVLSYAVIHFNQLTPAGSHCNTGWSIEPRIWDSSSNRSLNTNRAKACTGRCIAKGGKSERSMGKSFVVLGVMGVLMVF